MSSYSSLLSPSPSPAADWVGEDMAAAVSSFLSFEFDDADENYHHDAPPDAAATERQQGTLFVDASQAANADYRVSGGGEAAGSSSGGREEASEQSQAEASVMLGGLSPAGRDKLNETRTRRRLAMGGSRRGGKIAFKTRSDVDVLDDGYRWRKYGKKMVKNSPNPRNYYRCSADGCHVKKRVQREPDDARFVITTYDGVHNHPAMAVPSSSSRACYGSSA